MSNIPFVKLNNGHLMPAIALGTYKSTDDQGELAVKYAIDAGYRHIDTAYLYQNEKEVGKAIRDKINEGIVKRDELFICTKLWCTFHEEERVEYACRKSLDNLGLDYIDLYLMHSPIGFHYRGDDVLTPKDDNDGIEMNDIDYIETWKAMEKLVELGLVRSIGVSNFNSEQIKRILEIASVKPVNNQVEASPNVNQSNLVKFCKERDIVVTAYTPLGRPNFEAKTPNYIFDPKVEQIAKKHNKTPAQIVLRYLYENEAYPIPKSATKSRIEENLNIFDFALAQDELKYIDSFSNNNRVVPMLAFKTHKYFPLNIEF